MTLQTDLIKTLLKKEYFDMYSPYLHKHHFDETDGSKDYFWQIYSVLKEYHTENEADISLKDLTKIHLATMDGASKDKREALVATYDVIRDMGRTIADTDGAARQLLTLLKRRGLANEIVGVLENELDSPSGENWNKIKDIADQAVTAEEQEDIFYTTDLLASEEDYAADSKWQWFEKEFNDNVKGAGPGRNCLIVALTNVGKTSFTVFNAIGFMNQGAKVLHFAIAEDSKISLQRRYYQAAFNKNDIELDKDKEVYAEEFKNKYGDKLYLCPTDSLSVARAEQIIKQVKPDVVVFDDFKDLELGFKSAAVAPKLYGILAVKIKALAQKYGFFALCCAQAADSAQGKQILDRQDIADSKVDIPAKFEYVVGLSRGNNSSDDFRFVSFLKCKKGKENVCIGYSIDEVKCQWSR